MSQAVLEPMQLTNSAQRSRCARIGAGAAALAMAVVVYGTYGDSHASSSQKSGMPFLLVVVAVLAAVVYGFVAPTALRAVANGSTSARRWAVGLAIVSVLSLAVFWSGLPILVGGAAALVGHSGRSLPRSSRAYAAAWWIGLSAASLSVVVTILGNTVAGH